MKTRRLLVGSLIIGAILLLILFWPYRKAMPPSQAPSEDYVHTNSSSTTLDQNSIAKQSLNPPKAGLSIPADVQEYVQKTMADPFYDWKQPINFYGKVVDENEQPVANANVHFKWNDLSENGTSEADTKSDVAGFFVLTDKRGKRLYVEVGKEGYYTSHENRLAFEYANPADGLFAADADNPVVFHLRKKGQAEPLIVVKKDYRIPKDGTPVGIDLSIGKNVPAEEGSVKIECWTSERKRENGNRYDWKCQLSVPRGGLIESTNEFDFVAPVEGYRTSDEINMPHTLMEQWSSDVARTYFVKLGSGNYAYLKFRMIVGGDHFCVIESYLNPNGSPNLEFDPVKAIKP